MTHDRLILTQLYRYIEAHEIQASCLVRMKLWPEYIEYAAFSDDRRACTILEIDLTTLHVSVRRRLFH